MIVHHPHCTPAYPEKPTGEPAQLIDRQQLDDGYTVDTCVDCGAYETNLPPEDDPYWDEVRVQ